MRYLFACLVLVGCASTTPVTCDADGYHCRDRALTSAELGAVCPNSMTSSMACDSGEAQCHQIDHDAMGVPVPGPVHAIVCDDAARLSLK